VRNITNADVYSRQGIVVSHNLARVVRNLELGCPRYIPVHNSKGSSSGAGACARRRVPKSLPQLYVYSGFRLVWIDRDLQHGFH
jgi:hypothetical protein